MKDYSELEGKEVFYKTEQGVMILVVAGCDPDIGLTLHEKGKKDHNLICLTGPMSPVQKPVTQEEIRVYKGMFYHAVRAIRKGTINFDKMMAVKNAGYGVQFNSCRGDLECAFSQ